MTSAPAATRLALALLLALTALTPPVRAVPPAPSPSPYPTPSPSPATVPELPDEPDDADPHAARALTTPTLTASPTPPPAASTTDAPPAASRPAENFVRDDAQVFPASVTAALTRTIQTLDRRADLFVVTKVLEDMALFDQASTAAFKEIIDEVNHYRVVVVFIAYNTRGDRGIVSTNLGYGVWHIVNRKDCEHLFGSGDVPLTIEAIKAGVEKLVGIIAEYHRRDPDSPQAPSFTGLENLLRNGPRALAAVVVLLAVVWFWRRGSSCPKCGAPLKTRVSISLATTRTGRMAKKTYKCFRCGYTRRQSLVPTGYSDAETRAGPRPDEDAAEAEQAAGTD